MPYKTSIQGAKLQCQNCFGLGHTKHVCANKRISVREYVHVLKGMMDRNLSLKKVAMELISMELLRWTKKLPRIWRRKLGLVRAKTLKILCNPNN
ncbi:Hypothetical protein FKW44_013790, partial [Caligus rogercresseyi]